jgi:hypothetical protein
MLQPLHHAIPAPAVSPGAVHQHDRGPRSGGLMRRYGRTGESGRSAHRDQPGRGRQASDYPAPHDRRRRADSIFITGISLW